MRSPSSGPVTLLGVQTSVRRVEPLQYELRIKSFDYDMIRFNYPSSLSPGDEQINRWSSRAADNQGSFNFAGAKNPAVDAMIDALLAATERQDFVAAVRALDRALISGSYLVPLFHAPKDWWAMLGAHRPPRDAVALRPRADHLVGEVVSASAEPLAVDVVSDVVCPWCFVGKRRLDAAIAEAGLPLAVSWRPYPARSDHPAWGQESARLHAGEIRVCGEYQAHPGAA